MFKTLFSDVEHEPIEITFEDAFDPESKYMQPFGNTFRTKAAVSKNRITVIGVPSFVDMDLPSIDDVTLIYTTGLSDKKVHKTMKITDVTISDIIMYNKQDVDSVAIMGEHVRYVNDIKFGDSDDSTTVYMSRNPLCADVFFIPNLDDLRLSQLQEKELEYFEYIIDRLKARSLKEKPDDWRRVGLEKISAWDQIVKRAAVESKIGFPFKFRTMLFIQRCCMGEAFRESHHIKQLAYYMSKFPEYTPFYERDGANVNVDPFQTGFVDSMSPIRCHILSESAWNVWDSKYETKSRPQLPNETASGKRVLYAKYAQSSDRATFISAASGSGKSWFVRQHPEQFIDGDTLVPWPSKPEFWLDEELNRRVQVQHRLILRELALQPEFKDKTILFWDPVIADAVVDIPDDRHKLNLDIRSLDNKGQPTDFELIIEVKKYIRELALSAGLPIFSDFDELLTFTPEDDLTRSMAACETHDVITEETLFSRSNKLVTFLDAFGHDHKAAVFLKDLKKRAISKESVGGEGNKLVLVSDESIVPYKHLYIGDLTGLSPAQVREWVESVRKMENANERSIFKAYDELTQFIFRNPWENTIKYKKAKSLLVDSMLMGSKTGVLLRWTCSDDLDEFVPQPIYHDGVYHNDEAVLMAKKDDIRKEVDTLIELNLPLNANMYWSMINAPSTPENWSLAMDLQFLETMAGYFRGNLDPAFRKQVAGAIEPKESYPMSEHITSFTRDLVIQNKKRFFQTYAEYESALPGIMTTRNAGGREVEVEIEVNGRRTRTKYTNKFMAYYADPNGVVDRTNIMNVLSWFNPGVTFSRYVPARDTRLVLGIPIEYYSTEAFWIPVLMNALARHADFTITKESGTITSDHKVAFMETSNPLSIMISMDYSGFDAHENYDNFREAFIEGLLQGFKATGLSDLKLQKGDEVIWDGYADIVLNQYNDKLRRALFITKQGTVLVVDMVMSGEFGTITLNNITNYASFKSIILMMREHPELKKLIDKQFRVQKKQFQGDDSYVVLALADYARVEVAKDVIRKMPGLEPDVVTLFLTEMTNIAEMNNLEINWVKTLAAVFKMSYLKKTFQYGVYQPRKFQIQATTRERGEISTNRIEVLTGLGLKHTERVSRGHGHQSNLDFLMFLGATTLRVLSSQGNYDSRDDYWLPNALIYTPISMGGCGFYPKSIMGASKDAVLYLLYNRVDRWVINKAHHIVKGFKRFADDERVAAIKSSPVFATGVAKVKETLRPDRLKGSAAAVKRLAEKGIKVASPYHTYPENLLKRVLEDDAKSKELNLSHNKINIKIAKDNEKDLLRYKIKTTTFSFVYKDLSQGLLIRKIIEDTRDDCVMLVWDRRSCDDVAYMSEIAGSVGRQLVILHSHPIDAGVVLRPGINYELPSSESEVYNCAMTISGLIPKLGGRKLPDHFTNKFAWMRDIEYEWGDPVEYRNDSYAKYCPIAGQDPEIEDIIKRVGVSASGDTNQLKYGSIFGKLKDKFFPQTISDDEIYHQVSKIGVAGDIENTNDVLIAMGADPSRAMAVALELKNLMSRYVFLQKVSSYSTRDGIVGNLDLRKQSYVRLVSVPEIGAHGLGHVLQSIGFLMVLLDGGKQCVADPIRRVKMRIYAPGARRIRDMLRKNKTKYAKIPPVPTSKIFL
jgi:hypothetical protein